MTVLVQQRTTSDCSICCFAMALGRTYEDVIATVGPHFDPAKGLANEYEALKDLGLKCKFENGEPTDETEFLVKRRDWCIHPQMIRSWCWGRRAIITVPSLNIEDGFHVVYYDGKDLFDPSREKRYEKFTDLFPDEAVIFREAKP